VDQHTADVDQFIALMAKVEAEGELMGLGQNSAVQERFTTREALATDQRMEQAAAALAECQARSRAPRVGK